MKKITGLLICTLLLYHFSANAQSFAINTDGSSADVSALLDIKSTTKGLLIPRMTLAQKNAVSLPATGLLVYQTDGTNGLYVNNGTPAVPNWQLVTASGNAWGLTGNTGTVDGTNFIGTTDNIPLTIKVNNQKAGRIDPTAGNNFFGYQSGFFTSTGVGNSAFGHQNLFVNTAGSNNTSMGRQALYFNSNGNSNTALGYAATINNTVGSNNTSLGFYSLYNNVAGSNALAIGYQAMLYANNTATPFTNYNIALGYEALRGSTTPAANTGNYNTALGYQTLWSNTTGSHNNAVGNAVLYTNTTGSWNSATGDSTLFHNTTGKWNTANGYNALNANTTGDGNIAIGLDALYKNTSGAYNVATGLYALRNNTTGGYNAAYGYGSLNANTTGTVNAAFGAYSMLSNTTGIGNAALGTYALEFNTTGNENTAIGYYSNSYNMTGTGNTTLGSWTLYSSTAGSNGTAIGYQAMMNSDPSATPFTNSNVAVGYQSLMGQAPPAINTGNYNTALGYQTLLFNNTGNYNSANGYRGLYNNYSGSYNTANGYQALYSNSTGSNNTAMGWGALTLNIDGSNNTAIGYNSGPLSFSLSNTTTIGFNATVLASNSIQLGNNAVTNIYAGVGSAATLHTGYGIIERDLTIDNGNVNNGTTTSGLHFGASSGEVIASKRTAGGNQWGLDFYTNSTNRMSIGFNGYVGIGTSGPGALLEVTGGESTAHGTSAAIRLANTAAGSSNTWTLRAGATGTSTPAGGFSIGDNSAYRFVITNAGNVGIGNTAPTAALDVTGTTTTDGLQVSNGTVFTKMQSGSATVGSSGTAQLVYTVTFPVAFASATPRVFATARNEPASAFTDAFSVSVRSVTSTTVTFNIQRTDSITGWGQQLRVDWFAIE